MAKLNQESSQYASKKVYRNQNRIYKRTKRITLPIDFEAYNAILHDKQAFRHRLDEMIQNYPELFPADIAQGYKLYGMMPPSQKMPQV